MVFGPKPRDYTKKISKTTRRLAFQKALSERIKAGDVLTVDSFAVKEPKTKAFVSLVKEHTDAKKVLLISDAFDENTYRAARNVKPVLLVTATDVNTEQLLAFDKIIVTGNALAQLAERTPASTKAQRDLPAMNEPYDFIQTVQLTEKASLLSEKLNKYVFRVSPRANKIQIKHAIEMLFKKKVVAVNTCNYAGKKKRERTCRFRPQSALEKSHRDPEGRREDRSRLVQLWHLGIFAHSRRRCVSNRFRLFQEVTKSQSKPDKSLTEPRREAAAATIMAD